MAASNTVEYHANSHSSNISVTCHNIGENGNDNSHQKSSKTSRKGEWPVWFERASKRWWDLRMDSKVLEEQFKISSLSQKKDFFQWSISFVLINCISLILYFVAMQPRVTGWLAGIIWSVVLTVLCIILFLLTTKDKFYHRFSIHMALLFLTGLTASGLVAAYFVLVVMSIPGTCFLAAEVILLIYLIVPFPFPITFVIAVIFSTIFESLLHLGLAQRNGLVPNFSASLSTHVLLQVCLHLIGCQNFVYLQILRRSTFWKICKVIQTTQAKHKEEDYKDLMIKSVMPLSVAEKLMNQNAQEMAEDKPFRPFTMEKMDKVSILYADIVGFTQMSANKTAAELVGLLNDLFGRFDRLCQQTGCEKISTLGDCYYCVAGCPEARPDHAKCCVEMGLGMIAEIKKFCRKNNINVNMRVGIHTGSVLCGIVGTKRFKFDVWSNDVSLANGMEQHGIPGRIHISKATLDCLNDEYVVEDSKLEERDATFMEKNGKTYLIVESKKKDAETVHGIKKNGNDKMNKESKPKNADSTPSEKWDKVGTADANHPKDLPEADGIVESSSPEQADECQDALMKMLKRDQLMLYLGQHISPFSAPGPLHRLRLEEDRKFMNSIKDDAMMVSLYRNKEVNMFSMQFTEREFEKKFRDLCEEETKMDLDIETCISTRFRFFWDIIHCSLVTLLVFVSSILLLQSNTANIAWIVVFVVLFVFSVVLSTLAGLYVFHKNKSTGTWFSFVTALSTWTSRHIMGGVLLLIPSAIVFSHMYPRDDAPVCSSYMLIFCITLFHFLNFHQLMSWMRFCLAAAVATALLLVLFIDTCPSNSASPTSVCQCTSSTASYEYVLDVLLLLLFISLINRHFEMNYRLDFYSEKQVKLTDVGMKKEKAQVESLLHNFIPPHVSEELKHKPLYSKTHKKVGVIFGTIVNFNELYEETYAGGMEFIRYLSELISDVDDLLNDEKYKDIDKIKTIGTTMMLASGLNPNTDQENTGADSHLCRLVEFCMAMQDTVDRFNNDMMNFNLVLRIGFNHGEVTAGVIGATKRLYDIWGDTVNTASRMDSTGVPGRIQMSEESKKALENHFKFQFEAEKFVKGKGKMRTYLIVREEVKKTIRNPKSTYRRNRFS